MRVNGIVETTISQLNNKMIKIGSKVRYIGDAPNFQQYKGKTFKVYASDRKTGEIFTSFTTGSPAIYLGAPKKAFKQVTR